MSSACWQPCSSQQAYECLAPHQASRLFHGAKVPKDCKKQHDNFRHHRYLANITHASVKVRSAGSLRSCLCLQVEPAKKTSDWKEFTAPDGRKYYYNSATKVSSWTMPDELKKGSDTPSAVKASPAAHGTPSVQVCLLAMLSTALLYHWTSPHPE